MNHTDQRKRSRAAIYVSATLLAALVALALAACGGGSDSGNPESQATDYDKALADAPPPLADLYANGDEIIPGGPDEFHSKLEALRGHPVVVNAWASWCGPCRFEFPDFQKVSADLGDEVAFMGVDVDDSTDAANTFLDELPLPYPSVADPDEDIKQELKLVGLPGTAFYDRKGELVYLKQGPYTSEADLRADIAKYAS